jgi:A/G-specific adenine glycosylase
VAQNRNPYFIWVSEIILQQTRVEQGLPYYLRFIEQFPDIKELANSSEQSVLNVWKGLGYYSRARNMHYTAVEIVEEHDGIFPKDYASLIKLKGIGTYTAAAISSICNDENVAAIDGNVTRVIARYFGLPDPIGSSGLIKKVRWISNQVIPAGNPGDYNQAMMEYGAVICTPSSPDCFTCKLSDSCYAFKNKMVTSLPTKKKAIIKKFRFLNYLHIVAPDGRILMKQRTGEDIWKNLWEFPLIESERLFEHHNIANTDILNALELESDEELQVSFKYLGMKDVKHILTHQMLNVRFFTFLITDHHGMEKLPKGYLFIDPNDNNVPVSRLIQNFLSANELFFGSDK